MPWRSLGVKTPNLNFWEEYDASTQLTDPPVEGTIYRVTCLNISPGDKFKTYAWLRFRYDDTQEESFTRVTRIYPNPEPTIITVLIPPAVSIFPFSWAPQVLKKVYPRFRGRSVETPWQIKIEDYYPGPGMPDEQAIEIVDKISKYLY